MFILESIAYWLLYIQLYLHESTHDNLLDSILPNTYKLKYTYTIVYLKYMYIILQHRNILIRIHIVIMYKIGIAHANKYKYILV